MGLYICCSKRYVKCLRNVVRNFILKIYLRNKKSPPDLFPQNNFKVNILNIFETKLVQRFCNNPGCKKIIKREFFSFPSMRERNFAFDIRFKVLTKLEPNSRLKAIVWNFRFCSQSSRTLKKIINLRRKIQFQKLSQNRHACKSLLKL